MKNSNKQQNKSFANGLADYTEQDAVRDRWTQLQEAASCRPDIRGTDGPVLLKHILIALVALAAVILLPYIL